jgi:hypothetical protein
LYSNIITFDIQQPLTSGGTISGGATYCGSGNPGTMGNTTAPSGGCGGTITYNWVYRNGTSGSWLAVAGATGATYDPPNLTSTRQYIRQAKRSTCGGVKNSNTVTFTVNTSITKVVLNTNKSEYCAGETAQLTATVTGGTGLTYTWQWSSNGASWSNWGSAQSSNIKNIPSYNLANTDRWWRVLVTGTGNCTYTSHSVKTTYIANPNVTIANQTACPSSSATLTAAGYDVNAGCFDLADYTYGVDSRGYTNSTAPSNITASAIDHWTGCGLSNWFDIKRVGTGTTGYADYGMIFTAQNWTNFQKISVNQCQSGNVRYRLYIYDNNGWRDLGFSGTNGGTHTFSLPTSGAQKDIVTRIILRVYTSDLAVNQSVRFHLDKITICGNSISWNTGETTSSITKSPTTTTTYTATVKYGDCSQTETGQITITNSPTLVCETNVNNGGWQVDNDCSISICEGENLKLSVNPNVTTVNWSGPNGFSQSNTNSIDLGTLSPNQSGNYLALLTQNGCTASKIIVVNVLPLPQVTNVSKTNAACGQANGSITFTFANEPTRTGIEFSLDGGATGASHFVAYTNL